MAQGTLRRDSWLCVNTASFLVKVLWKYYLKDRKKYKSQRGEARTKSRGEETNLWDPTQSGWLDAQLSSRIR